MALYIVEIFFLPRLVKYSTNFFCVCTFCTTVLALYIVETLNEDWRKFGLPRFVKNSTTFCVYTFRRTFSGLMHWSSFLTRLYTDWCWAQEVDIWEVSLYITLSDSAKDETEIKQPAASILSWTTCK